jgi:hypothetical protein
VIRREDRGIKEAWEKGPDGEGGRKTGRSSELRFFTAAGSGCVMTNG